MAIRADVRKLQNAARKLRLNSNRLEQESASVNGKIESMTWEGNVYRDFIEGYYDVRQSMRTTANDMESFASRLESLAERFRQEDLEEERREKERQEREREKKKEARRKANS
ncbi:WXG100 family type VII secretion target [Paenibacillus kandeliae]|uniref:WXG100 family type VII secretion target n=1 Tax=Paenibacillus kandeliae TaxID=3231269 RepID=UPI003458E0F8